MSTWDSLIAELQRLNQEASKIQSFDDEGVPLVEVEDSEIERFVSDYLAFYSESLALLPEDLKDLFRTAYEKSIKDFLINPTDSHSAIIDEYEHIGYFFSYPYSTYFYEPFFTQRQLLLEASKREPQAKTSETVFNAVEIIERIGRRFDLVARQLTRRYNNRETLIISDEYDVQNLFHAPLKIYFDDVRPEEWTPSYAGNSSRIDFLLKREEIVIEIKKTRNTLKEKEISNELIIDKERYRAHTNCKTLLAFVYDPDKHIDNPIGLETDLSEPKGNLLVKVVITQG